MSRVVMVLVLAAVVAGCGASPTQTPVVVIATQPPLPTYTPYPTYTPLPPLPTYTPYPTYTPNPLSLVTPTPLGGCDKTAYLAQMRPLLATLQNLWQQTKSAVSVGQLQYLQKQAAAVPVPSCMLSAHMSLMGALESGIQSRSSTADPLKDTKSWAEASAKGYEMTKFIEQIDVLFKE